MSEANSQPGAPPSEADRAKLDEMIAEADTGGRRPGEERRHHEAGQAGPEEACAVADQGDHERCPERERDQEGEEGQPFHRRILPRSKLP